MTTTRAAITSARTLVVKVGSSSITEAEGGIDGYRLQALATVIARSWTRGQHVVLVSSGAIAAGLGPLRLGRRPTDLATQQAAASAGQGSLMAAYSHAFDLHGLPVGQVLLTSTDMTRRSHYVNARRTLHRLLDLEVVPIVNENDTVATDEIRFGDNDRLAALVAQLIDADVLVLLSDVDALYTSPPHLPGATRLTSVPGPDALADIEIGASGSGIGTGGMATKVSAAQMATDEGIPTLVTSAQLAREALAGEDVGTWFLPTGTRRQARRRWIAHASDARGRLVLDDGAVEAILTRQTSLLPVGVTRADGAFEAGDTVSVCRPDGVVVARGVVGYGAEELAGLLGRRLGESRSHARPRGARRARPVVRRDDLVVLAPGVGLPAGPEHPAPGTRTPSAEPTRSVTP